MLSTLAVALSIAPTLLDVKTTLPSGVAAYVRPVPGSKDFALCLFVSTKGRPEPKGQVGLRHLIEHLVAKGTKRDLDAKLESRGVFLSASTSYDGVRFEMEGPSWAYANAIHALRELLDFREITQEEVAREVLLIEEERAVRPWTASLTAALWNSTYGETVSDPLGLHADLAAAAPAQLKTTFAQTFVSSSMSVSLVGGFDQSFAIELLSDALGSVTQAGAATASSRSATKEYAESTVAGTTGSGRALPVGPVVKTATLATLAAAFALAAETPGATVSYEASPHDSIVALLHPSRTGLGGVDGLIGSRGASLLPVGRSLLLRWIATMGQNPRERAKAYAMVVGETSFFRVEDLEERARTLTIEEFEKALKGFGTGKCHMVGGER